MIYYRGPNWIPNRQQPTPHNHQQSELGKDQQKEPSDHQKETLSGDLLRTIQNLNLLMDQMHRHPQNWIVQKNLTTQQLNGTIQNDPQLYSQAYQMTPNDNQTTSYNHPNIAYDQYNQQYDQNFQQLPASTYDTSSLTYVNQTSH